MSGIGDSTLPIVMPLTKLPAALLEVQKEIKAAIKSSDNPFFHSKYADLAEVWDVIRKPLQDNGFTVIQLPGWDSTSGRLTLQTILLHVSGENISSTMSLRPTKDDPQAVGSAITYARRYALAAMVGVVQEDDDGQDASRPETEQRLPTKTPTPPVEHKPATPSNAPRPGEPSSLTRTAMQVNANSTSVPDALEEATGLPSASKAVDTSATAEPTGSLPPATPPSDFPTKEEKKDYVSRAKVYTRGILPKAGIKNGSDVLKAFITKTTGQEDVRLLTKTQWEIVLIALDAAAKEGNEALLKLVS